MEEAFQRDPELPFRFLSLRNAFRRELQQAVEQEGVRTRQEALLRLLFGDLSPAVVRRIETMADVSTLDTWLVRILDAHRLEEMGLEEHE